MSVVMLMLTLQAVTLAVFSEAEGNSLLAGLEKAGASLRPEGSESRVRQTQLRYWPGDG